MVQDIFEKYIRNYVFLCSSRNGSSYLFVLIKILNIKTVMSPCILLSNWPVKVVKTKGEEASCEEGVGEGQHPGVHVPHHGLLQAPVWCPDTVGCKYKYHKTTPDWS